MRAADGYEAPPCTPGPPCTPLTRTRTLSPVTLTLSLPSPLPCSARGPQAGEPILRTLGYAYSREAVKQVQALSGGVFGTVGSWLDLVRVRVSLTLALTLTRWAAGSTWLGLGLA